MRGLFGQLSDTNDARQRLHRRQTSECLLVWRDLPPTQSPSSSLQSGEDGPGEPAGGSHDDDSDGVFELFQGLNFHNTTRRLGLEHRGLAGEGIDAMAGLGGRFVLNLDFENSREHEKTAATPSKALVDQNLKAIENRGNLFAAESCFFRENAQNLALAHGFRLLVGIFAIGRCHEGSSIEWNEMNKRATGKFCHDRASCTTPNGAPGTRTCMNLAQKLWPRSPSDPSSASESGQKDEKGADDEERHKGSEVDVPSRREEPT